MLTTIVRQTATSIRSKSSSLALSRTTRRHLSKLDSNPHIFVFPDPANPSSSLLTLLKTNPPTPQLAIGNTPTNPPTPSSFRENSHFLTILHSVIATSAHADPQIKAQAAALASSSGATLTLTNSRTTTGSAGASAQGGAGGAGQGGYIHVSDNRHPPDFGRIAEPEDIFGSLEVDPDGSFTDGHGRYQSSGTYRVVTRDGVLGLPDYLRARLVERLEVEEAAIRNKR